MSNWTRFGVLMMKKKHKFYSKLDEEKSFCPVSGNKQEFLAERFI